MDRARDINCVQIIQFLADCQATIEFIHSIFACDWRRASLLNQYEGSSIKINVSDSIHRLTWLRTSNRAYSKYILEVCLDTNSSEPFELIFNSSILKSKVDVNIMCTDGLPFFFHMFHTCFSNNIRQFILSNANLSLKTSKGETFLFHLIRLYDQCENDEYLNAFNNILNNEPLLVAERNEQGRTIVDHLELLPSLSYHRLRIFYDAVKDILIKQLTNNLLIERLVLNGFGYHLLLYFADESVQLSKFANNLLYSLKCRRGVPALIHDLTQAIVDNDLAKVKDIFRLKSNICFAKDWWGRTCTHLAVLYGDHQILQYEKFVTNFYSID